MLTKKSDMDWDLIAKHLVGETDIREEAQLAEWRNSSEANQKRFAELERWWRRMEQIVLYGKVDVVSDWQKLKRRLNMSESLRRMRAPHRNLFGRYSFAKALAAAVALLLVVGAALHIAGDWRKQASRQPETMAFNRIHVPAGQQSQIMLADGTSVWLNSGSSLQIPLDYGTKRRTLHLEGEGYFEVTACRKTPFVVRTANLDIRVHGTSFNVSAYPNDLTDEVALMSGSLTVANVDGANEILLKPGQKISYTHSERLFTDIMQADAETETAWRYGKLVFENAPFGEIAKKLERRYGVSIRICDKSIEQLRYRGVFRKESLEQAIRAIQLTAKYQYKIEDDTVVIYK
jgi:ferric-dicitrate binding protein FerR (iron transport regulator)